MHFSRTSVRAALALAGLILLAGCKEKPRPAEALVADAGAEAEPEGWALTLPKLDAFLGYQRALMVQAGKLTPATWDGGLQAYVEPDVEERANFDARARK